MKEPALKELLYKMADDLLVYGHRNSEWTGMGPLLEEDIAFSSMAQDKIGQSLALFTMLHQLGEQEPDTVAFMRNANQFHNCILVELPNEEYDFSLCRHFLFDTADSLRWEMLTKSSYEPLAQLARKVTGELRYHTLHANTWLKQLGTANEDSIGRLQHSMDRILSYALGIFEKSPLEKELIDNELFAGEDHLLSHWQVRVEEIVGQTKLKLASWNSITPVMGGRKGDHSKYLQPMLDEMSEVFRIDPTAEW
jgi:ring-1,2-phenylacetyl-CoA epoxidase subunit PaaC